MHLKRRLIIFVSASAGELDWICPIAKYLIRKNFRATVIFLSKRAEQSVKENRFLLQFLASRHVDTVYCGGPVFEFIDKYSYLLFRISLKLNLPGPFKIILSFLDTILKFFYIRRIIKYSELDNKERFLIFSEFPSLRKARNNWIKKSFTNSLYFYHPHSTNINIDLNNYKNELKPRSNNGSDFLLLSHPSEFKTITDSIDNNKNIQLVCLGHPKYSSSNLLKFKKELTPIVRSHKK